MHTSSPPVVLHMKGRAHTGATPLGRGRVCAGAAPHAFLRGECATLFAVRWPGLVFQPHFTKGDHSTLGEKPHAIQAPSKPLSKPLSKPCPSPVQAPQDSVQAPLHGVSAQSKTTRTEQARIASHPTKQPFYNIKERNRQPAPANGGATEPAAGDQSQPWTGGRCF